MFYLQSPPYIIYFPPHIIQIHPLNYHFVEFVKQRGGLENRNANIQVHNKGRDQIFQHNPIAQLYLQVYTHQSVYFLQYSALSSN